MAKNLILLRSDGSALSSVRKGLTTDIINNSDHQHIDEFGFETSKLVEECEDTCKFTDLHGSRTQSVLQTDENLNDAWKHYLIKQIETEFPEVSCTDICNNAPKRFNQIEVLKSLVARGVPHSVRSLVWPRITGALQKEDASIATYEEIVKTFNPNNLPVSKKDLCRVMPQNVCFHEETSVGISQLHRVLCGLTRRYPNIEGIEGCAIVVSTILLFADEKDVFWILTAIIDDLLPAYYFGTKLVGVRRDQIILKQLIKDHLPDLDMCFEKYSVDISLICYQWFMTLFCGLLQLPVLLRVLDRFLLKGSVVLFQVALAIFKSIEKEILSLNNSADIFNVISNAPASIHDAEVLVIHLSFGENCINKKILVDLRESVAESIQKVNSVDGETYTFNPGSPFRFDFSNLSLVDRLFTSHTSEESKDTKLKNIHQTELVSALRTAIQNIVNHFQRLDPSLKIESSPDYTTQGHCNDDNRYFSFNQSKVVRAKAIIDFTRSSPDELEFKKNDVIKIISKKDEHCWIGSVNGEQGWFPSKFVEVLDERTKTYCPAGDASVNSSIIKLVCDGLCPALFNVLEHGLRKPVFLGSFHPWQFIEEASGYEVEKDFDSVYSRLVLCKTFKLDEDGKVLAPQELLYKCVQSVNYHHSDYLSDFSTKFKALVCSALNEQSLHLWLDVLCHCTDVVKRWYHPWSFVASPGWMQIKCELRILSKFTFYLTYEDAMDSNCSTKRKQSLKQGVCDMLIKHHLFSWEL